MTIYETIKKDMREALKAKDEVRLTTLRSVLSALTNELVAQKKKPDTPIDDEMALTVLGRLAKQRKEAIEQYTQGGRPELAEDEQKELAILEAYLPAQMSREEIAKVVMAKKEALGISDKSQMGQLMGAVIAELKGKADGKDVKEVVESSL